MLAPVAIVKGYLQRYKIKPKSVVRLQTDSAVMPCRLAYGLDESVAGYAEARRETAIAVNIIMLTAQTEAVSANRLTFNDLQNLSFCTAINALLASN